jgi:PAS domain S-box-containing protein
VDAPITANILIVDDRPDKLLALTAVLSDLGHNILTSSSGKDAIRLLLQHEFAVILLDVSMPIMDGFETAALIRKRDSSSHTPIIFVTAINATETHVTRGYSLGAVDYIFSPIVPEILRAKVLVFIDLFVKSQQVKRQSEWMREEAERRASELETRMRVLLNRLNVGVYRSTLDGRFIEANPAFLRLLGIGHLAEIDQLDQFDLAKLHEHHAVANGSTSSSAQASTSDVLLQRADGRGQWLSVSRTINVDGKGNTTIDGLVEDITARKIAEEDLSRKQRELERSNDELEQFAYVASHDLQEPLRMISSYLGLLQVRYTEHFDDKANQFMKFAVDGAERMQNLISDLLVYSRITSPEHQIQPVPSCEALDEALKNLETKVHDSGAAITHDVLPTVVIPRIRLVMVFQNLIGNSLKFCSGSSPRIDISSETSGGFTRFSVKDNGIGFNMENAKRIFDIFQRLHSQSQFPGTGIGLASCKKIIECSGGRIWVESALGNGSTFHFTVPAP